LTAQQKPRRSWRFFATLALIAVALAVLLQDTIARAIARFLANVWVATMDLLFRLLGAPLGG
jgi:hypothetical protein